MGDIETKKVSLNISTKYFDILVMIAEYLNYENLNTDRSQHSDSRANKIALQVLSGEMLTTNSLAKSEAKINAHSGICKTQSYQNICQTLNEYRNKPDSFMKKDISALMNMLNATEPDEIKIAAKKIETKITNSISNIIDLLKKNTRYIETDNNMTRYFKRELQTIDIDKDVPKTFNLIFRIRKDIHMKKLFKETQDGTNPSMRRAFKHHMAESFAIYGEHIPNDIEESIWSILDRYDSINKERNQNHKKGSFLNLQQYFINIHKISKQLIELEEQLGGKYGNGKS